MIAVDTNLLVRILADDPGQLAQVKTARALASQAQQVFLLLVVQIETVWVLESGYKLPKEVIIQALEHLEVNQAFVQEDEDLSHRALGLFRAFWAHSALPSIRISLREGSGNLIDIRFSAVD